jgi:outer membrane protein insertion porin family
MSVLPPSQVWRWPRAALVLLLPLALSGLLAVSAPALAQGPAPGPSGLPEIEYVFERAELRGNLKTRDGFILRLLDLEPGDRVTVERLDRFRRDLLATGFFTSVDARLSEGTQPQSVVLDVLLEEESSILLRDVFLGFSAASPFWGGLELAETNLVGTGLLLSGGFVLSTEQAGVRLRLGDRFGALGAPFSWTAIGYWVDGAFRGDPRDLTGVEGFPEQTFEYQRLGGRLGIGIAGVRTLDLYAGYRLERVEQQRVGADDVALFTGIAGERQLLGSLYANVRVDLRDLGGRSGGGGLRAQVAVDTSGAYTGSAFDFTTVQGGVSYHLPIRSRHALLFDVRGGVVANAEGAPFFEGFYVGDLSPFAPGRALGVQLSDRRGLDLLGTGADLVSYADAFVFPQVEWTYDLGSDVPPFRRVELFTNVGVLAMREGPWEAGRGPRRLSPEETALDPRLRPDLTFDVGLRADTIIGDFAISLGTILSLLPLD